MAFDPLQFIQGGAQVPSFQNRDELESFLGDIESSKDFFQSAGQTQPLQIAENLRNDLSILDDQQRRELENTQGRINRINDKIIGRFNKLARADAGAEVNRLLGEGNLSEGALSPEIRAELISSGILKEGDKNSLFNQLINSQGRLAQEQQLLSSLQSGGPSEAVTANLQNVLQAAQQNFPGAFQAVQGRLTNTQSDLNRKLGNLQANIANVLDLPPNASAQEVAQAQARASQMQQELSSLQQTASQLGVAGTQGITRESSGFIPTSEVTTQLPGGPAPTPVDNVIDGRSFVESQAQVEVGSQPTAAVGQEQLAQTVMGTDPSLVANQEFINGVFKAFHGRDATAEELAQFTGQNVGQARDSIIAGSPQNLPAGSAFPAQGAVQPETGGQQDQGFLSSIGSDSQTGAISTLTGQMQGALQPGLDAIQGMQQQILDFVPEDLSNFRQQLQSETGIDNILNELANVDASIAELVGVERRVPATTLDRAHSTEITQGTLDRQRTIELGKLASALAPLSDVKAVLENDLSRRTDLIDEAVNLKKEAESFKLQQLGNALDFAVTNFGFAKNQAEQMFNAALSDYEFELDKQEQARVSAQKAAERQNQAIEDYYKAIGFVINPLTGEVVPTLAMQKFNTPSSSGGSSGGGSSLSSESLTALSNVLTGKFPIAQIPSKNRGDVFKATEELAGMLILPELGRVLNKENQLYDPLTGNKFDVSEEDVIKMLNAEKAIKEFQTQKGASQTEVDEFTGSGSGGDLIF